MRNRVKKFYLRNKHELYKRKAEKLFFDIIKEKGMRNHIYIDAFTVLFPF